MMERLYVCGICLMGTIWLGACAKQSDTPPPVNDVYTLNDSTKLPPVPLQRHNAEGMPPVTPVLYQKKIDGPVTGKIEDLPPLTPNAIARAKSGGASSSVTLNDGDPKALLEQVVTFITEGNLDGVAAAAIAEQHESLAEIYEAIKAIEPNLKKLHELVAKEDAELAKKFEPDAKGIITLQADGGLPIHVPVTAMISWGEIGEVTVDSGDKNKATATVKGGADNQEIKVDLVAVDGKWRVHYPNMPANEDLEAIAAQMPAVSDALAAVTARVESGEVKSADVMKEWITAIANAVKEGGNTSGESGAEKTEANASDAEPQKKTTRSGRDPNSDAPTLEESLGRQ